MLVQLFLQGSIEDNIGTLHCVQITGENQQ